MWGGGGGGGEIMGLARPIFFREKGGAKREFHDGWGWIIVCFVENHTHFIGDSVVNGATLDWKHRQTPVFKTCQRIPLQI